MFQHHRRKVSVISALIFFPIFVLSFFFYFPTLLTSGADARYSYPFTLHTIMMTSVTGYKLVARPAYVGYQSVP